MPQFIACRFGPLDTRRYTYVNDGAHVAVGDFVRVPSPRDEGAKKVEVMSIVEESPKFVCKAILGKVDSELGEALRSRCPTCGRSVKSIFDHVDVECEKWPDRDTDAAFEADLRRQA
jgi:hypothetical protein